MSALGLPDGIAACLFDLDGVLTQTAKLHAAAWKEMFDRFLRARFGAGARPFDPVRDYAAYVDGKLRADGARSFLAARGVTLSDGEIDALAEEKDAIFVARLHSGVEVYAGSIQFLDAVRAAGLRTAVVSASKHCRQVLVAAGLDDKFDARIDGLVAGAQRLAGKPAPDTYLAAARALAVAPRAAAVFEDALAGVAAGRAGGFGFVVGVDRARQGAALRASGADVVVCDLAELLARPSPSVPA